MRRAAALLLLLTLACGPALQLRLASEGERLPAPGFHVGERGTLRGASFSVSACPLQPLLWALTSDAPVTLPLRFVYGEAPPGLRQSAPAPPLEPGRLYFAAFAVGHRSSTLVFRAEAGGRVEAVGDADACARVGASVR